MDHVGLQFRRVDSDQDDLDPAAQVEDGVAVDIRGGGAQDLRSGFQAIAVEVGLDLQEVGAGAEVADPVPASGVGAEDEGVAAGVALQVIVAAAAGDAVGAGAAEKEVVTGTAAQDVVAFGAEQDVDALAAADGVVAGRAVDQLVLIGTVQRLTARRTGDADAVEGQMGAVGQFRRNVPGRVAIEGRGAFGEHDGLGQEAESLHRVRRLGGQRKCLSEFLGQSRKEMNNHW